MEHCGATLNEVTILTRVTEEQINCLYAEKALVPGNVNKPRLYALRKDGRGIVMWPPMNDSYDVLVKPCPL